MTTIIVLLVAVGAGTPNATAYGVAPCGITRGEPS